MVRFEAIWFRVASHNMPSCKNASNLVQRLSFQDSPYESEIQPQVQNAPGKSSTFLNVKNEIHHDVTQNQSPRNGNMANHNTNHSNKNGRSDNTSLKIFMIAVATKATRIVTVPPNMARR